MEKLTGRIVGVVVQVEGRDEKRTHYFIETEPARPGKPAKRQRIEVEDEPPYEQKTLRDMLVLDRYYQVEGIKYKGKFMVKKENIRPYIDVPRARGKK